MGEETKLSLFPFWEPAMLCAELLLTAGCQRVSMKLGRGQCVPGQHGVPGLQSWLCGAALLPLKLLVSKTSPVQKQMQNQPFVHTHIIKKEFIQRDIGRLEGQPSVSI